MGGPITNVIAYIINTAYYDFLSLTFVPKVIIPAMQNIVVIHTAKTISVQNMNHKYLKMFVLYAIRQILNTFDLDLLRSYHQSISIVGNYTPGDKNSTRPLIIMSEI